MTLLQKPSLAVVGSAVAGDLLPLDAIHHVVIVPAKLLARRHVLDGEECQGGEPQVVTLGKDVLDKNIWITAMVEITSDISLSHGVHDVDVFIRTIQLPD